MYNKTKISKVLNVYQEKYTNNEYCTGLGDFIRGSLCLFQYADMRKIECDMHYTNHPISDFLQHSNTGKMEDVKEIIEGDNVHDVEAKSDHVREEEKEEEKEKEAIIHPFRVFCYKSNHLNNHPTLKKINHDFSRIIMDNPNCIQSHNIFTLYTIAFPAQPISETHKQRVRDALCPNPALRCKIDATMHRLKIQPKEYNVIHVRTGDEYLIQGAFTSTQLLIDCKRAFLQVFSNHELTKKENDSEKYVIISDNVDLKQKLKYAFPKLIMDTYPITHLGENACGKKEEIANTLVDFFLIANACRVFGFSTLNHGTGFSQQCCQLYSIPYTSRSL